jgi:hypothetical protein
MLCTLLLWKTVWGHLSFCAETRYRADCAPVTSVLVSDATWQIMLPSLCILLSIDRLLSFHRRDKYSIACASAHLTGCLAAQRCTTLLVLSSTAVCVTSRTVAWVPVQLCMPHKHQSVEDTPSLLVVMCWWCKSVHAEMLYFHMKGDLSFCAETFHVTPFITTVEAAIWCNIPDAAPRSKSMSFCVYERFHELCKECSACVKRILVADAWLCNRREFVRVIFNGDARNLRSRSQASATANAM